MIEIQQNIKKVYGKQLDSRNQAYHENLHVKGTKQKITVHGLVKYNIYVVICGESHEICIFPI